MVAGMAFTVLALASTISTAPTASLGDGETLIRHKPRCGGSWRRNWSWSWEQHNRNGDDSSVQLSAAPAASTSPPVADHTPARATGDSSPPFGILIQRR